MSDFERQATRHVALVLDNDEGLYFYRREIVQRHMEDMSAADVETADVAASLREWCEELVGLEDDSMSMLTREILTLALAYVDWETLARDYIAEEGDE